MTNMLIDSPIAIAETTALTCGVSPINAVVSSCNSIGAIPVVTANPQNRAYFEYKIKDTSEWLRLEFQTDIESTDDFERLIEALDPATEYEFRSAYGKDRPVTYGSIEEFKTEFLCASLGQSAGEGIEPSPTVSVIINAGAVNTDAETFIATQNISNLIITGIAITDAVSPAPLVELDISHERINAPIVNTDDDPIVPELIVHRSEWLTTLPPPDTDAEGIVPNVSINQFIAPPLAESDSDSVFVMVAPYVGVLSYIEYKKQGEELWETTGITVIEETGNFSFDLESLDRGTTYEFRAVGEQEDILYGSILTFKTPLVLVDDLAQTISEGIAPFIPDHMYNYPQPAESESIGTAPEIYTEFPCNIDIPVSDTSVGNGIVPVEVFDERSLKLSRIGDGIVRLEWKWETVWAGMTEVVNTKWHSRNLEITIKYRRDLMTDLSNVHLQQFQIETLSGSIFPTSIELNDDDELKIIFNDFYQYLQQLSDAYQMEAHSESEAFNPDITATNALTATSNGEGIEPEINLTGSILVASANAEAGGSTPIVHADFYLLTIYYYQSTNENFRLKDFYGDDVDTSDHLTLRVSEELYTVTFVLQLEVV